MENIRKKDPKKFAEAILWSSQYACINIIDPENMTVAEDIAKRYNVSFSLASDEFLYLVIKDGLNYQLVIEDYENNRIIPDDLTLITYIGDQDEPSRKT